MRRTPTADFVEPIDEFPVIDPRLLACLEKAFPAKLPGPDTTEREDLYHAGERNVIRRLHEIMEHQHDGAVPHPTQ